MRIVRVPGLIAPRASAGVSAAVWLTLFGLLWLMSAWHESVLPARFLLDKDVILVRMRQVAAFVVFGDSFDNLAWVIKASGVGVAGSSFIGFALAAWGMLLAVWASGAARLTPVEFFLVLFWALAQTAYIGLPSKEIVISLLVVMMISCRGSRWLPLVFVGSLLFVVVFFRLYWAIILSAAMGLYLAPRWFRSPIALAGMAVLIFFSAAVLFRVQLGESLDFARKMANDFRVPGEVGSMIVSPLPGTGTVIDVVNALLILGTFLVPYPLLASGVVTQAAGGTGIFLTIMLAARAYLRHRDRFDAGRFERLSLCFFFSFLVTQAIFEPDYGSFLRHLSPVSPLLIYMILRARVFDRDEEAT